MISTKPAISIEADTYCDNYKPVCLQRADTELTQEQVKDNEATHKRLCPAQAQDGDRKCQLLGMALKAGRAKDE